MTVALYMDHHVHSAMTEGLLSRGVDVITSFGDGTSQWEDEDLLQRSTDLGRVLFSQDRDLLAITHHWQQGRREFGGLVYAHQLSITIGQAIRDLELIATVCTPEEMRNRIEFLPL